MFELIHLSKRRFMAIASEFELSPPQVMALRQLDPDEPKPMSELAARAALRQLERHRDRRPPRGPRPRRAPPGRARPAREDAAASPSAAPGARGPRRAPGRAARGAGRPLARGPARAARHHAPRPRSRLTPCSASHRIVRPAAPRSVRLAPGRGRGAGDGSARAALASGLLSAGRLPGRRDALRLPGVADRRGAEPEVGGRLLLGRPRVGERRRWGRGRRSARGSGPARRRRGRASPPGWRRPCSGSRCSCARRRCRSTVQTYCEAVAGCP